MNKKVVIVSSSFRKDSNSELLARAFGDGAETGGNQVQFFSLKNKNLQFCTGCMACQKLRHCVITDDASAMMDCVGAADVLVFATPIYYYSMAGQLKTFLDRMNPLFSAGHQFRAVYLIASAADGDGAAMDGAVKEVQGWVDCFDGVTLTNVLRATGVDAPGAVQQHPDYLSQARALGIKA